jgi:spoIIIJ-associated protein
MASDEPRDDNGADDRPTGAPAEAVDPNAVGEAAVEFMTGLASAFGSTATATLHVDGSELDVRVDGDDLGLLIGPGGRTLMAVQDLARVAAQRRLGDHDTRLRIDVAGYRERRRAALERFAVAVAHEVRDTGRTKALEPMASADRKIVHDSIHDIEGVASHSDGEEPRRRVVITPA